MTIDQVNSTASLYKYYVGKKLLSMGCEVFTKYSGSSREPDWDAFFSSLENFLKSNGPFEAAISMAQRGYISRGKQNGKRYYNLLKKYCRKVTTICDNIDVIGFADITYYATPINIKKISHRGHLDYIKNNSLYVGWAADPNTCKIEKDKRQKTILIDHAYYDTKPYPDWTNDIVNSASNYMKKNKNVIFNRFVSNTGVERVRLQDNTVEIFNRSKGLRHIDACREYSKSDIFVVTHPESMGLSVIESAMAGALVLSPKGFIKRGLISPLHHLEFSDKNKIPWDKAIRMVDHNLARSKAMKYNWDSVSSKIANSLIKK